MRIPAAAVKPLSVLAVAAVSFGCITPAYEQDAIATVTSDDSNHIVVDINLHDDTDTSGSDSKSDSSSTDENDSETTGEAKDKKEDELKGKWWERACGDIPAFMPKVAEQVAKPLTAVDSIKMYGSGNAQKLVKETTSIVDQVASGLKDSTGVDLPSLLNGLLAKPDTDIDTTESPVD